MPSNDRVRIATGFIQGVAARFLAGGVGEDDGQREITETLAAIPAARRREALEAVLTVLDRPDPQVPDAWRAAAGAFVSRALANLP